MPVTITQTIELRCQLEADILKLIGDFERNTQAQIRSIDLRHVETGTICNKVRRRFVADLTIEVSL